MDKIPKKVQDIVNKKQEYIDANRSKFESSVISMQEQLFQSFVENILPELDMKDGQILNTSKNLRLIESLDNLYNDFNSNIQSKVVTSLGEGLVGLNKLNTQYFNEITLNDTTKKKFDSIVKKTNELMSTRIGVTSSGEISTGGFLDSFVTDRTLLTDLKQSIIKNVTGQQSLSDFKESVKTTILGTDKVSGGFEKYYRQYAYDTYQQYDRAYGKNMADEFGMNYALYQGGLINDSRDFCRAHENKVFTRDEIQKFDKWRLPEGSKEAPGPGEVPSYIAKFPDYNPFVDCGGFSCRHSLTWVTNSYAERVRPELKKY